MRKNVFTRLATGPFFQYVRICVAALLIGGLILPSAAILSPAAASAAELAAVENPLAQDTTDNAEPTPSAVDATYTPTFDAVPEPLDEPITTVADTDVVAATFDMTIGTDVGVDTEAHRPGIAAGVGIAGLPSTGGATALGALPLTLTLPALSDVTAASMGSVQAEILPAEVAQQWTPSGLAFTLAFSTLEEAAASALAPAQPFTLTVDYSALPLRIGGSYVNRLTLYRVQGEVWHALSTTNDAVQRHLSVQLDPHWLLPTAQAAADTATGQPTPPVPLADQVLANKTYLPLVAGGLANEQPSDSNLQDEAIYVLAAAASGPEGNYKATPFQVTKDYEVALATGSFQTSYALPLPPAPAALAPDVALQYDSGSVDGLTTTKNNQPSWVGLGWTLQAGHITRHLKACENAVSPGDLCIVPNAYSIVLNGTGSRLVQESGNLYRLQHDPRWKAELFSNGDASNPDSQKEYWLVTTPDGTQYRFGNERDPETNADHNSVFYTPVYDATLCAGSQASLCNKAWQWNLDRVQDPNGNLISYFYNVELNY